MLCNSDWVPPVARPNESKVLGPGQDLHLYIQKPPEIRALPFMESFFVLSSTSSWNSSGVTSTTAQDLHLHRPGS
eukprot:5258256-Amphidinium_carterae.1